MEHSEEQADAIRKANNMWNEIHSDYERTEKNTMIGWIRLNR